VSARVCASRPPASAPSTKPPIAIAEAAAESPERGSALKPRNIGAQTNGSVIRPASYCGVVGVKPGYGTTPVDGVFAFAPTFDTVGSFARSVRLAGSRPT
jgi:hypothetical protein